MVRIVVGQCEARFDLAELLAELEAGDVARASDFLALFREVAEGRGACWLTDSESGIQHTLVESEFARLEPAHVEAIRRAYVNALYEDCNRGPGLLLGILSERATGVGIEEMLEYMALHDGTAAESVLGFNPWLVNQTCEVCMLEPATVIESATESHVELHLCAGCQSILFDEATWLAPRSRDEVEIEGGMMQWRDV